MEWQAQLRARDPVPGGVASGLRLCCWAALSALGAATGLGLTLPKAAMAELEVVASQREAEQESGVLGHCVTAGAAAAPRLLAARVRALPAAVHLVPQPRGAFSDLAPVPLASTALKPHEVSLPGCLPNRHISTRSCVNALR